MKLTHYEVLEVCPRASPPTIRAAFKSLVQRHHPDRHGDDRAAVMRTQALTRAYEILSDAERRAAYDASLATGCAETAPHNHSLGWSFPGLHNKAPSGSQEKPSASRILQEFSWVVRAAEIAGRGEIIHFRV